MTEPRFYTSVTDSDKTAPISADALGARDSGGHTERGSHREDAGQGDRRQGDRRGQAERGTHEERRPEAHQGRSGAPADPLAPGWAGETAGGRGGEHLFRSAAESRETPFAARYVDPAFEPGGEQADRGSNGRPGYQPPAYAGSADQGRSSSPGGVPAAPASGVPGSGERDRPGGGAGSTGYGGASAGAAGGQGWSGYGASSYASGYTSGETTSAGAAQYATFGGYGSTSNYASPSGPAPSRVDPAAAAPVVGAPGTALPAGTALGAPGAGHFTGGSTLGSATAARPATRVGRAGAGAPSRPGRRARLLVRHIDPWSTLKFSLVLAVAMFFVWLVAVGVLYGVLDGMGVFDKINGLYDELAGNSGQRIITPGLVLGTATLVGAVNIVLMTALATIGAFVYNICSDLVGGIEITLAERD